MADALISLVVQELHAMAKEEVTLLMGVEKEVSKLSSMFTAIQAVLEDAEKQQVAKKAVQDWLGKLKEVAYEVEDILDEWRTDHALISQGVDQSDIRDRYKVRSCLLFPCLSCYKKVELRHDIGHRIMKIIERLNQISMEKSAFGFNFCEAGSTSNKAERETGSLIDESEIFGRWDDKESIISKLVCETDRAEKSVSVVSIVGMGGLGKTTLAQQICNDERVKSHFKETIIWVCVSDNFDVKTIATKVIRSMGGETGVNPDLDTLQHLLHEVVGKKRFLLVLDDVWNENDTEWEKLRVPLIDAAQGSRIVVTTRSHKVAQVLKTSHMQSLGILSDLDCWKLFTSKAFKGREEKECQELKDIGEKIVHKCKGLPLALKAVGSLLYFKRTKFDWELILESETWKWDLPEDKGILPALLLSYYSLPLHLKQCFQFCSVFPKDYEIDKDELVKLWMAHGFIRFESLGMEEIGESYFDDLLARSLFQEYEQTYDYENIVTYKMHDLVHDLAKFVTTGDYCTTEIGNSAACSDRTHHLSVLVNYYNVPSIPSSPLCNTERLRTFLLFGVPPKVASKLRIYAFPDSLFKYLIFLRALDLSGTSIESFSSLIGRLKHLRYLSLNRSEITELPECVTDLCNLQTLKLNGCLELCKLPSGISKMVKLRHLEIAGTQNLTFLPHGLGRLTYLRTLHKFVVGDENRGCKIRELKSLNLLRGNLEIHNLERVMNGDEAREAELDKKYYLGRLSLNCEYDEDEWETLGVDEMERMESVFDALRPPHSNLKELHIWYYVGSKFPNWLGESIFSSLVVVTMWDCKKCRLLPGLGKLPSLEFLHISGADAVNVVGGEFYGNGDVNRVKGRVFPKLEQLSFKSMKNWEEWRMLRPENVEVMSSLRKLSIIDCPKLKALPDHLPITLRVVNIKNCNELIWTPCHPPPLVEYLRLQGNVQGILSRPLPCLPTLKKLEIYGTLVESLPSDGWGLLESLHTLDIDTCHELMSLPDELGLLKALQTLVISRCPLLTSLPDKLGQLETLHAIKIDYCQGLTSLLTGLGQFKALQTLHVSNGTELRSLSDGLVQLEALQAVHVSSCTKLETLVEGFEQLEALRSLIVFYCQKLRPLPKLQHLTTLEELKIRCCPLVTEQLKKEKGEGWCSISHIPCIEIDWQNIQ